MAGPAGPGRGRHGLGRTERLLGAAAVLVVVAVAILLRALPLTVAAPYPNYVDEPFVLERSAHMIDERTADAGWYGYPPLLAETTAVATLAWDFVGGDEVEPGARRTVGSPAHSVIEPFEMVLAGRLIVLATGVGTVLLTIVLGARLLGSWQGIAAGLLAAVVPALVTRSSIVIVDTPATFFVMGGLVAAVLMTTSPRAWRWAALAGASSGLAFTAKYPAGAVIAGALGIVALTPGWDLRRRIGLAGTQVVAMAGATVVSMPGLLTSTGAVRRDIRRQAEIYDAKTTAESYLDQLRDPSEVGTLLLVWAVVGLAVLLIREPTRRFTTAWLGFALVVLAFYLRVSYQPFRNLLPLVPFLCIAAIAAVDGLARLLERRTRLDGRRAAALVMVAIGGWALLIVIDQSWPLQNQRLGEVDHRVEARWWLRAEVGPGDRVLVAEELSFLPSELRRLEGEVVVARFLSLRKSPPTVTSLDVEGFDYVVTGRFERGSEPGWAPPMFALPALDLPGRPVKGVLSWSTNHEHIRIYEQ